MRLVNHRLFYNYRGNTYYHQLQLLNPMVLRLYAPHDIKLRLGSIELDNNILTKIATISNGGMRINFVVQEHESQKCPHRLLEITILVALLART